MKPIDEDGLKRWTETSRDVHRESRRLMRRAHFKVSGRNFNRAPAATVTIEIGQGHSLLSVRPHRRRKRYTLPLEAVAAWVIERCVKLELREKRIR